MELRGKKVLVTGADGFIGSHLVERLVQEGASVRAFVYYNSFSRWGWLEEPHCPKAILDAIEFFPGDVRDSGRVGEAVAGCDVVFHLASLIAIPYSYKAPESFVQTNVVGTLNVLQACLRHGISRIVHTSTSEVYGTALRVPIDEGHPLQPQSPYSASKISADMLAHSYYLTYGLPVVIVRPFNTYGPRQSARAVIPTILSQLHSGHRRLKLGSLAPRRDFNYVTDTVAGFICAASCDRAVGETLNVATGNDVSIAELLDTIFEVTGLRADVECEAERLRPEKSEVMRLCGDASRLREWTGWVPLTDLRSGLSQTSEWVARNLWAFKTLTYNI